MRFAAQAVLWRTSSLRRVRYCGKHLAHGSDGVQLRVSTSPHDGQRHGGFAGLQSCGSVWSCPVCSSKVLGERQTEIGTAVDAWVSGGGRVALGTLTVRHHAAQSAAAVWDAVSAGWTGVTSGRAWQAEKRVFGVQTTREVRSGKRAGQTVPTSVLPWVRVTEVTHGVNGWHVHLHVLLFLPATMVDDELTNDAGSGLFDAMWSRWDGAVTAAGFAGGVREHGGHVKFMTGREVVRHVSEYVTKSTYTDAGAAAGAEVARGDLKDGRFGNRSSMQLLRDVVLQPSGDPAQVRRDVELWHEFERASKGRRQMTWAVGARDLLALGVERDDEEIAAEEVGTAEDAVVYLDGEEWRRMIRSPGRRAELITAVETSVDAALALLDGWGIDYEGLTVFGTYVTAADVGRTAFVNAA